MRQMLNDTQSTSVDENIRLRDGEAVHFCSGRVDPHRKGSSSCSYEVRQQSKLSPPLTFQDRPH
jgi:hypothetical protein